jgi:TatD DNase family protein
MLRVTPSVQRCPAMLNGERGRKLAARMPGDRDLTETDGPLAQLGSQSLQPWQVEGAVAGLGSIWSFSAAEADKRMHTNLLALVGGQ